VTERLNNELKAEQAQKVMLQEELQQEHDKTKKQSIPSTQRIDQRTKGRRHRPPA
jgi:hypothetical protein